MSPHGTLKGLTLDNGLVETWTYNSRLQSAEVTAGSLLTLDWTYCARGHFVAAALGVFGSTSLLERPSSMESQR